MLSARDYMNYRRNDTWSDLCVLRFGSHLNNQCFHRRREPSLSSAQVVVDSAICVIIERSSIHLAHSRIIEGEAIIFNFENVRR